MDRGNLPLLKIKNSSGAVVKDNTRVIQFETGLTVTATVKNRGTVVVNGSGGGGGGSPLTVQSNGTPIETNVTLIDFIGDAFDVFSTGPTSIMVFYWKPGLVVYDEGTRIALLNPSSILNFTGPGVVATNDSGDGKITVTGFTQTPYALLIGNFVNESGSFYYNGSLRRSSVPPTPNSDSCIFFQEYVYNYLRQVNIPTPTLWNRSIRYGGSPTYLGGSPTDSILDFGLEGYKPEPGQAREMSSTRFAQWITYLGPITSYFFRIETDDTVWMKNIARREKPTDAEAGVATFIAGTVTVNTNKVTANSIIILSGAQSAGLAPTIGKHWIDSRVPGVSFTIKSSNAGDNTTTAWQIFEPY